MNDALMSAQCRYGFEQLGPVVAYYLSDLDAVLQRLVTQRNGQALFASRGGLLIKAALDAYRVALDREPTHSEAPFYVSRFLAAKGAWLKAPEQALKVLDREFQAGTAAYYAQRLNVGAEAIPNGKAFESFSAFMAIDGPLQRLCRAELDEQSALFESYFASLTQGRSLCVLVDTGWQATIQQLLSHTFPGHELWGAYFGRIDKPGTDPRIASRVLGLAFNASDYDPRNPLSAITHHRHLIEALFEPVGDSIERLMIVDGRVSPIGVEAFAQSRLEASQPSLFSGVLRFLREARPSLSYAELSREKDSAAARLANDILYPTRETAELLGSLERSVDFGSRESVATLIESAGSTLSPEQRIRSALWAQGQIALECRPAIARERQRILVKRARVAETRASASHPWNPAAPKVAVIMRTMDRLMFLDRAFESVARQTFDDYILVIFNDGGDVAGVESELARSRLDRRKVVLLDGIQNRGMEAASNAAIRAVQSEYIVIHDDDDSWLPDFLKQTAEYLDRNERAVGVVTHAIHVEEEISGDQVVIRRRFPYNDGLRSIQLGELLACNSFPPISFLFRRRHYDEVGGFNEDLPVLGDWDFNIKLSVRGEIGVIPERLANYHFRSQSGGGAYDNSIVGGASLHQRFNAVVRGSFVADQALRPLAGAMAVAPMINELTKIVRANTTSKSSGINEAVASFAAAADDRWCMLAFLKAQPEQAADLTLVGALAYAAEYGLPTPPDFDEVTYIRDNADVRSLLEAGDCPSGYVHFMTLGRAEGRRRPSKITSASVVPA